MDKQVTTEQAPVNENNNNQMKMTYHGDERDLGGNTVLAPAGYSGRGSTIFWWFLYFLSSLLFFVCGAINMGFERVRNILKIIFIIIRMIKDIAGLFLQLMLKIE